MEIFLFIVLAIISLLKVIDSFYKNHKNTPIDYAVGGLAIISSLIWISVFLDSISKH